MAVLEIVSRFQNAASAGLKDLKGDLADIEQETGLASRGMTGLQSAGTVAAGALAAGVGAAAVAAVAGAKASLDAFMGFEQGMKEVFTLLPGISEQAMGAMSGDVLSLAREVGKLPEEVVPALYQALSAGVPPDNVFEFLRTANQAAVGGVTELNTAVDGITSVVNAYGSDVVNAAKASDLMFTAVKLGKTDFEQLSRSLFNVVPTASALGVGFEDITGAMARMTAQGVPTSVATTQMRQLFVELSKSGGKTAKVFEDMAGQSFAEFIAAGGNTADALDVLRQAGEESGIPLQDLFSSVEAGSAALSLAANGTDDYRAALDEMANSAGATETAYETMSSSLKMAFDKIRATVATVMISIGQALAPVVKIFADWVAGIVDQYGPKLISVVTVVAAAFRGLFSGLEHGRSIGESFASFLIHLAGFLDLTENQYDDLGEAISGFFQKLSEVGAVLASFISENLKLQDVLVVIGGVIGSVLVPALIGIVSAAAPVIALFLLLVGAVALVRNAWERDFGGIRTFITGVFQTIVGIVQSFVTLFTGKGGLSEVKMAMEGLANTFGVSVGTILTFIGNVKVGFEQLKQGVSTAIEGIRQILSGDFAGGFEKLKEGATTAVQGIITAFQGIGALVGGALQNLVTSIREWFQRQDWQAIGQTALDRLMSAFSSAGATIGTAVGNIVQAITGFIQRTDWANVGRLVINGIVMGLGAAIGLIVTAARLIWEAISNFVSSANWPEIGKSIVTAVVEGLKSFGAGAGAALSEWKDELFNWANVTSWGELGDLIVEKVVDGLSAFGQMVQTKLSEWTQAFFDWAGVSSWGELGATIVEKVVDGLSAFGQMVQAKLSEWYATFQTWATSPDTWYSIGYAIVDFIIAAIEFREKIEAKLAEWWQSIWDWVTNTDWDAVGDSATTSIADSLKGFWEKAVTAFTEFFTSVANWFNEQDWSALGASLIDGIKNGIASKIEEAKGMISGLVGGMNNRFQEEQGIQSPSTVWAAFGAYLMQGLAGGIVANMPAVSGAIGSVADGIDTSLTQGLGDAISSVAAGVGSAMAAISTIGSTDIRTADIIPKIEKLKEVVFWLVQSFAVMAFKLQDDSGGHALSLANSISDTINKLAETVDIANEGLKKLAEMELPPFDRTVAKFDQLAQFMAVFTRTVSDIARDIEGGVMERSQLFADTANRLLELIAPAVDALVLLSEYVSAANLQQRVQVFARDFSLAIGTLAVVLTAVLVPIAESVQFAAQISDALGSIIDVIEPGIDALVALSEYVSGENLPAAVGAFATDLTSVAEVIAYAFNRFLGPIQQAVSDAAGFSEAVGSIADVVKPGIDALTALSDYVSAEGLATTIGRFVTDLAGLIEVVAYAFNQALGPIRESVASANEISSSITDIIAMIEPGLAALLALSEYATSLGLTDSIYQFVADLTMVISAIESSFWLWLQPVKDSVAAAGELSAAIGQILQVIEPGLAALAALPVYAGNLNLDNAVNQFAADLTMVISTIESMFWLWLQPLKDSVTAAGEMSAAIGQILQVIEPGLVALAALPNYVSESGVIEGTQQFAADLTNVITELATQLSTLLTPIRSAVEDSAVISDDVGKIVAIIQPAIDALQALTSYAPAQNLDVAVGAFAADITTAIDTLATEIDKWLTPIQAALAAAGSISGDITSITGVVQPMVDALAALAEYETVQSLQSKVVQFTSDFIGAVETLATQMDALAAMLGTVLEDASAASADIQSVVGAVQPTVDALAAMAEYKAVEGLPKKVEDFIGDMTTAVGILAAGLDLAAQTIGDKVSTASTFASDLSTLTGHVADVVDSLDVIGKAKMPAVDKPLAYITDSAEKIQAAISGSHAALGGTVVKAANDFAANAEAIVGSVKDGLDSLDHLATSNVPGSLQNILNGMVQSMRNAAPPSADAGRDVGNAFIDAVIAAIKGRTSEVEAAVRAMVQGAISAGLGSASGAGAIGTAIMAAATQGVNSGANQLSNAASNAVTSAVAAASRAANSGTSIGTAMMQGMTSGVASGTSRLVSQVSQAANQAAQAARDALQIQSPSRIFERIAELSIEGWVRPWRRTGALAMPVTGAFSGMVGRVGNTVNNSYGNTMSLKFVLPNDQPVSAQVESRMREMVKDALREVGVTSNARRRM